MTSGYHPFISVLFRLNVPVFSGTLRPYRTSSGPSANDEFSPNRLSALAVDLHMHTSYAHMLYKLCSPFILPLFFNQFPYIYLPPL
ncbi:hypothetical protein K438DRAFT_1876050 [Mycena galopus ATCC 62051]|nr:hypothetical protein K438DRAFT_1876050 [Mycena galopus ATCC 62051]